MVKLAAFADKEVKSWQDAGRIGLCEGELWEIAWHDIRRNLQHAPERLCCSAMDYYTDMVERRLHQLKPTPTQEGGVDV